MAEATKDQSAPVEPEFEAEAVAKARLARLMTTGSSAMPVPEAWPFEGTIGAGGASYDPPYFAAELQALIALRGQSGSLGDVYGVPFYIGPEEVPSYRALEGDPITGAVSVPNNLAIWGQGSRPSITVREHFGPGGRSTRTIVSLVKRSFSPSRPRPSGRQALEDLSRSTGLSHEALGALLGASRRSVYNWLRGRAMSPQFEMRALRLRAALRPLAERRAPGEIATWLRAGPAPPAELLRQERWEDVAAVVQQELEPRVLKPMPAEPEEGEPEAYSAGARRAVLAGLRTPPPVEQKRRPDWRPREVTGVLPLADNDEVE